MASLIAWGFIGLIFFVGIVLERRRWTRVDIMQFVPCMVGVILLWPFGLAHLAWCYLREVDSNG